VLDDLPAMDDATERRGAPPTHVQFGEATAVLAAISLLNEGYRILASLEGVAPRAAAAATYEMTEAVGVAGLTSGQWRDLNPLPDADAATIAETHAGKTGALFGAALAIPGALAGQTEGHVAKLRAAGIEIGTAFQGYDDLLDRYAKRAVIGKDTAADQNRRTVADVMDREAALVWCGMHLRRSVDALAAMGLSNSLTATYIEGLAAALSAPLEIDPRRIA
ncbi:MAG: polyprenyl synthetase family protein, partial [Pseudomonadota bacterium]